MLRPWTLDIEIDKSATKPIYLQIADIIIESIKSGRLPKGTALPGSRTLANSLQVNRNTVIEAIQVLLNEEWLTSQERRGTFVSHNLPISSKSKSLQAESGIAPEPQLPVHIPFDDGHPDSKIAPVDQLGRAYRQIFKRNARWKMMGYSETNGNLDFRKAIASMLNQERNMQLHENQLCITRGSQMAMYLVSQCLLRPGDYVIVESPGYSSAWKTFEKAGANLIYIPVDSDGIVVEDILPHLASNPKIKAIYLTPHRQYPTTVTLSLQRRLELVSLSNQYQFTIIEDDYDYEFHFGYRPLQPISAFSELENVVYIGTLSKVVAPALRIGYLATKNQKLLDSIIDLRRIIDIQGDSIMEQAVLELIKDGTIKRHIRKATLHYQSRQSFMVKMLDEHLATQVSYHIPQGGLAFWICPQYPVNWTMVFDRLTEKSISILHPSNYYEHTGYEGLRLGYGSVSEEQIKEGIIALADILAKARLAK
ncbi:MocR-like pyridoxine biosynthesis transcription factor PdxR [Sphingobacterium paucimobilis]|uniref:HTH gntR-type domain-containing protein n=1 Tax=Sphingobacterium paucimobilis HER1398 TaxID=1346330 RepID=U2HUJ0_9SPHI|nr:PLP-dependent aminotransferase family protein [Sphingobacterium paucimobilis]ERJ59177.1 hypothetical protein M472_10370 [Sphingobacterium paucimobilis HER1398]